MIKSQKTAENSKKSYPRSRFPISYWRIIFIVLKTSIQDEDPFVRVFQKYIYVSDKFNLKILVKIPIFRVFVANTIIKFLEIGVTWT